MDRLYLTITLTWREFDMKSNNILIIGLQHGRPVQFAVSACTIKRHGGLDMYLANRAIWLTGLQHYWLHVNHDFSWFDQFLHSVIQSKMKTTNARQTSKTDRWRVFCVWSVYIYSHHKKSAQKWYFKAYSKTMPSHFIRLVNKVSKSESWGNNQLYTLVWNGLLYTCMKKRAWFLQASPQGTYASTVYTI